MVGTASVQLGPLAGRTLTRGQDRTSALAEEGHKGHIVQAEVEGGFGIVVEGEQGPGRIVVVEEEAGCRKAVGSMTALGQGVTASALDWWILVPSVAGRIIVLPGIISGSFQRGFLHMR